MIGNDVIDILQSRLESNWRRKGFIQKLFTPEEQLLISNTADPEIMVWLLWSMKEAAYKIYNRQTKIREYIPQKLVCSITSQVNNSIKGTVACLDKVYFTETILSKDRIHTVAVSSLHDLCNIIEIEKKSIIKDKEGIPNWFSIVDNQIKAASVSHHGRFELCVSLNY